MASWIIHLRVAQQLYQKLHIEPIDAFVLGNIAPDSGVPTADGSGFVPDTSISHFRSLDGNGIKKIHENRFIGRYFTQQQRKSYPDKKYAFFLGYLTHLLTDQLWPIRSCMLPKTNNRSFLRLTAGCSGGQSSETGTIWTLCT